MNMIKKLQKIKVVFLLVFVLGRTCVVEGMLNNIIHPVESSIQSGINKLMEHKKTEQILGNVKKLADTCNVIFDKVDKVKMGEDIAKTITEIEKLFANINNLFVGDENSSPKKSAYANIILHITNIMKKIGVADIQNYKKSLASVKSILHTIRCATNEKGCGASCQDCKANSTLRKNLIKLRGVYDLFDENNEKGIPAFVKKTSDFIWYLRVAVIMVIVFLFVKICKEVFGPLVSVESGEKGEYKDDFIDIK